MLYNKVIMKKKTKEVLKKILNIFIAIALIGGMAIPIILNLSNL